MVRVRGRWVHFGSPTAQTFADGASEQKRSLYLARHGAPKSRQRWDDIDTPGYWARWVLWEKPSIEEGFALANELANEIACRDMPGRVDS